MANAVLVDDTDPNILYTGSWLPVSNYGDMGNFGQPWQNTFHSALSASASLTYNFTGYGIEIYGINQSASEETDPPFSCSVDRQSYPTMSSSIDGALCQATELSNSSHMLELIIPLPLQSPFLLDYIKYYRSLAITPEDHATVLIDFADPQALQGIYNGTGWEEVTINETSGLIARDPSITFEFEFNGTSLTWFGLYDEQYPSSPTTANYSIDGQNPVSFPLKGVQSGSLFNQIIFQTTQLPSALHKIIVNYGGNNNTTPLSITTLVIQNGTLPEPPQSFSPTATNLTNINVTTTSSQPTTSLRTTQSDFPNFAAPKIGPIVGGSLVAVFVGVCITIAMFLWRRRHRRLLLRKDIQAFRAPPSTYLPTWLHRRKHLEGTGSPEESNSWTDNSPRMIPPRKLSQIATQNSPQAPSHPAPVSTNIPVVSRIIDTQEEDSGMRLEQISEGNSGTVTRLLPPAYTEL